MGLRGEGKGRGIWCTRGTVPVVWDGSAPLALPRQTAAAGQGDRGHARSPGGPAGSPVRGEGGVGSARLCVTGRPGGGAGHAETRSSAEARPRIPLLGRSPSQIPRAETHGAERPDTAGALRRAAVLRPQKKQKLRYVLTA